MTTRLYLHAGFSKTGTTALQASFTAHADLLKQQGLLYPPPAQWRERIAPGRAGNATFLQRFMYYPKQERYAKPARKALQRLERISRQTPVLLSQESMAYTIPLGLRAAKEALDELGLEPVFILGLRETISRTVSGWRQQVRNQGLATPLQDYLEEEDAARAGISLLNLVEVFGRDAVRTYRYSSDGAENMARFLACIGPELSLPVESEDRVNRSLDALETEIIRFLNAEGVQRNMTRHVADCLLAQADDIVPGRPVEIELSEAAHARYREEQEILNRFLPAEMHFDPVPGTISVRLFSPDGLSPGLRKLARTLAVMAVQNRIHYRREAPRRALRALRAERSVNAMLRAYFER